MQTSTEWGKQQHENLKRLYEHGSLAALIDALGVSSRCQIPLPRWAAIGIATVIDELITGKSDSRVGQHAKWLRQYHDDMNDLRRYETITELREHGVKWKDVYQSAADMLEGSAAECGPDAMETAYKRYKRRERQTPWRYHIYSYYRPPEAAGLKMNQTRLDLIKDILKFDEQS